MTTSFVSNIGRLDDVVIPNPESQVMLTGMFGLSDYVWVRLEPSLEPGAAGNPEPLKLVMLATE